jgi:deoxyribodipyrimidine photo-lyase
VNDRAVAPDGAYVLYWMVAARRLEWSFALDRAVEHARRLGLPLVILEALRVGYRWASDRHHAFALDGMRHHAERLAGSGVGYHPYVEPSPGAGKGLLAALAQDAAVVVTDEFPAFFLPRMVAAAAEGTPVLMEAVDGNGLLPLTATPGPYGAAVHFRRFLQRTLPDHLPDRPDADPLGLRRGGGHGLPPAPSLRPEILRRWPAATPALLSLAPGELAALPIDHDVAPSPHRGGGEEARGALERFLDVGLARYREERNHPDVEVCSRLSPYLHWGHISTHEIFWRLASQEDWSPNRLSEVADGRREGWWGMGPDAEAFLDQLVTWRELGFGFCHHRPEYAEYDALPEWALDTLEEHAADPRPYTYTHEDFDLARTHDEVWNAAQNQLRREGHIHNYLRMLWGKKILEWSAHPREALATMIELNNRYALDGRDPNSYSGIFWVMGRFDRGWPERAVFGKVRSMTTASTRRKVRLHDYLRRWGT